VADAGNETIREITSDGRVTTFAGMAGMAGTSDGPGAAARIYGSSGIAVDGSRNIYMADYGNNTIRKITPAGVVMTLGGVPGLLGSTDGSGGSALFAYPTGIAVDGNGNLYVADNENNALRLGSGAPVASVDTSHAWLGNLSARAFLPQGASLAIAGFVTAGPSSKLLPIRADGPALAVDLISGFFPHSQLTLFNGQTALGQTESWGSNLGPVFSRVEAFPLQVGSHDDALLQAVAPGANTAQVASQTAQPGVVLAEIYDADAGVPTDRLVNISARAHVGTGANVLLGGFVIEGTTDEAVLIRADGPALATFGVTDALRSPVLTLFDTEGAVVATNVGWGNPVVAGSGAVLAGPSAMTVQAASAGVFLQVGAFGLRPGSADAAMVVALPPGAYTAQVSGANGATGMALVEIYEIHP
jgi:hypothetical protein